MYNVCIVSLGCPKNQVDAEMMLKDFSDAGFKIGVEETEADAIIINTCGFIEEAKKEAIENIIEAARYKKEGRCKAVVVTGCLAERYKDEVTAEIPEADVCVGLGAVKDIVKIVKDAIEGKPKNAYGKKEDLDLNRGRILGGVPFSTYIKIGDGCDNCCTYCAIPQIRGRMRSRRIEDIIEEAKQLAKGGVSELIVVAQDTTAYGTDLYGKPMLCELLKKLCEIKELHWIRTLYTYPERISDEFLELLAKEKKLVKYLDMPIQHCNKDVLKRMNRKGSREELTALINKIREKVPNITLRTTLITGFPGETEEQFNQLHEFVKEMRFERLGCFPYSAEEGTIAANMENQIDEQTKIDRMELIMESQFTVTEENNKSKIGKVFETIVEGYDDYIKCYFGRTGCDAPEIDTKVFFTSGRALSFGEYVKVKIFDTLEYDLMGELI